MSRRSRPRLQLESLEIRELFTGDAFAGLASGVPPQVYSLVTDTPEAEGVVITNRSSFTAEFTMRFNDQISVNLRDLVSQIRAWDHPGVTDLPDYQKAYHYLLEYHEHDFPLSGRTWMHEPSLYLNSLGAGLCDDAASALSLIWQEMGYEARVWLLQGHVAAEVHADGKWQLYDPDLRVVYQNREGLVAGVEELASNPDLITNPVNRDAEDPFVYSRRIASIYSTDDNRICTGCTQDTVSRDLIFQIPAGGSLEWGEPEFDRELVAVHIDAPENLGQIKLNVPAGYIGAVDIPLALHDVQGETGHVILDGQRLDIATDEAFRYFNSDTSTGSRLKSIGFDGSAGEVEVTYFFNKAFLEIRSDNSLEITPTTDRAADLSVGFAASASERWTFDSSVQFANQSYYRLSDASVAKVFDGDKPFRVNAQVTLNAGESTRRPILDAYRFALEIDAENRPYVYYRADDDSWVSIRGTVLQPHLTHELQVLYEDGKLELVVNGQLEAVRHGSQIDATYPVYGPYIGKSEHLGGMYFTGRIDSVSIQEVAEAEPTFNDTVVAKLVTDMPSNTYVEDDEGRRVPVVLSNPSSVAAIENLVRSFRFNKP